MYWSSEQKMVISSINAHTCSILTLTARTNESEFLFDLLYHIDFIARTIKRTGMAIVLHSVLNQTEIQFMRQVRDAIQTIMCYVCQLFDIITAGSQIIQCATPLGDT